jgi:glycosyltransferase involved in cell wall biosynthesis
MSRLTRLLTSGYYHLRDRLRFHPATAGLASWALALRANLTEARRPVRALELLARAARGCGNGARARALERRLCERVSRLSFREVNWHEFEAAERRDIPKAIILKPPVSPAEKGLLYIFFEEQWLRLLRTSLAPQVAQRYDLLLGPSWSPPHDVALLLAARFWPGKVYTLLSNLDDAPVIRRLSQKLVPIPLLASHWTNPDVYAPYLHLPKTHDIVMVATFSVYKRHWLFFDVLRQLPRHYRVLLIGRPVGNRDEASVLREARAFGAADRFELRSRLSDAEVAEALCRARVSLIFSGQEGSCIAVTESLLANTPVGMFRNARVGSKPFINRQTGVLLDEGQMGSQIMAFVTGAERYTPRQWALENVACNVSSGRLNQYFRQQADAESRPWTADLCAFYQNSLPLYCDARAEREMAPWYADFSARYNLHLGRPRAPARERDRVACPL